MSSSSSQQCPSCLRQISFSHANTNVVQCSCASVIFKNAEGTLLDKPYYILNGFLGAIQPGTKGVWKGQGFEVLGRFRAWMEEFVFNYWTVVFDNGRLGYLGEGYGIYSIYDDIGFEERRPATFVKSIRVGEKATIYNLGSFVLERKYSCYKFEIEGEAFAPDCILDFKIFEFASGKGRHIEFIEFQNEKFFAFNVTYASFNELSLTNTRPYTHGAKISRCFKCSKDNVIKAYPFTQSYACIQCGHRYALENGNEFKELLGGSNSGKGPALSLGATGVVKGIEYEVTGFAVKEEKKAQDGQWREYTLYNQVEGFAFLSEYNGHWIYAREKGDAPVLPSDHFRSFKYDNKPFQIFNSYKYDTLNTAGEFPYNIFNDDDKQIKEFIAPPEMWIREQSSTEGIIWFKGEHISGKELKAAFGDNIILPHKGGIGAIEPKNFVDPVKLLFVAFAGALLLLFAYIFTSATKQRRIVLDNTYTFDSLNTFSAVTPQLELDKWRSNLEFAIVAPVDNSWFELNATLVNVKTGKEYSLEKGVEYYHGYSESESWEEGGRYENAFLSSIPQGTYYLQIQGIREQSSYAYTDGNQDGLLKEFQLTVRYDVPMDRNLFICLVIFLVCAFIQYKIVNYNERRRWRYSPFTPYTYED